MEYSDAEKHFGSQGALARAFDPPRSQSTVAEWKAKGHIPRGAQFELQVITAGALRADRTAAETRRGKRRGKA